MAGLSILRIPILELSARHGRMCVFDVATAIPRIGSATIATSFGPSCVFRFTGARRAALRTFSRRTNIMSIWLRYRVKRRDLRQAVYECIHLEQIADYVNAKPNRVCNVFRFDSLSVSAGI